MWPSFRCLKARCSNHLVSGLCHPNYAARKFYFQSSSQHHHMMDEQPGEDHVPGQPCFGQLVSTLIIRAYRSSSHRCHSRRLRYRLRQRSLCPIPLWLDQYCGGADSQYVIIDALVYGEGGGGSTLEQAAAHGELTILMCQQVRELSCKSHRKKAMT